MGSPSPESVGTDSDDDATQPTIAPGTEEQERRRGLNRFIMEAKHNEEMGTMFGENFEDPADKERSERGNIIMGAEGDHDDKHGYYQATVGELMDEGRYKVLDPKCGAGMFSNVVRCRDEKALHIILPRLRNVVDRLIGNRRLFQMKSSGRECV